MSPHLFQLFGDSHGGTWSLWPDELHQALKVLRLSEGEQVLLTNGQGLGAKVEIAKVRKHSLELVVLQEWQASPPRPKIVLVVKRLKPKNLADLIPSLVELGCDQLALFDHSALKPLDPKSLERLRKIIREATKVSKRLHLLELTVHNSLEDYVITQVAKTDLRFVALPEGSKTPFEVEFAEATKVHMAIGSEAGWLESELDILNQNQFQPLNLGTHTLRSITAAHAAMASLSLVRLRSDQNG